MTRRRTSRTAVESFVVNCPLMKSGFGLPLMMIFLSSLYFFKTSTSARSFAGEKARPWAASFWEPVLDLVAIWVAVGGWFADSFTFGGRACFARPPIRGTRRRKGDGARIGHGEEGSFQTDHKVVRKLRIVSSFDARAYRFAAATAIFTTRRWRLRSGSMQERRPFRP